MKILGILAATLLFLPGQEEAAKSGLTAILCGKILTVSGKALDRGVILVEEGIDRKSVV